jgi:DNA (cytosine-5)-methyltransferase 1
MVASLRLKPELRLLEKHYARTTATVRWAVSDLLRLKSLSSLDRAATPSPQNQRRIDFLVDHGLYDLPNSLRPSCHRLKDHSYKSVYGRMHWDRPAQTITSGFKCMGQGRFVHPKERRTLTAHEAARLQFIPDFFSFGETVPSTALATMIANAVPPKLAYVLALELLR